MPAVTVRNENFSSGCCACTGRAWAAEVVVVEAAAVLLAVVVAACIGWLVVDVVATNGSTKVGL